MGIPGTRFATGSERLRGRVFGPSPCLFLGTPYHAVMPTVLNKPMTTLVAGPSVDEEALRSYFDVMGGMEWFDRVFVLGEYEAEHGISDAEALVEYAARRCYRSFSPDLNVNVTKVREDSNAYFDNILKTGHGSVLEHAQFTFAFEGVSRVFTHELVRHRVGVAISQESMRYVRLTNIPFWFPDWATEDRELMERCIGVLEMLENHQRYMALHFELESPCGLCNGTGWAIARLAEDDRTTPARPALNASGKCERCGGSGRIQNDQDFAMKKFYTSFMRRFAPEGVATGIIWSANIRTLRHTIALRTATSAEEEIRLVFDDVAQIMKAQCPMAFSDFERQDDGSWAPLHRRDSYGR